MYNGVNDDLPSCQSQHLQTSLVETLISCYPSEQKVGLCPYNLSIQVFSPLVDHPELKFHQAQENASDQDNWHYKHVCQVFLWLDSPPPHITAPPHNSSYLAIWWIMRRSSYMRWWAFCTVVELCILNVWQEATTAISLQTVSTYLSLRTGTNLYQNDMTCYLKGGGGVQPRKGQVVFNFLLRGQILSEYVIIREIRWIKELIVLFIILANNFKTIKKD